MVSYFYAAPPAKGLEGAIDHNRAFFAGFPDMQMTIVSIVAEGDRVIHARA